MERPLSCASVHKREHEKLKEFVKWRTTLFYSSNWLSTISLGFTSFVHDSLDLSQRNLFHLIFGAAMQMSGGSEYTSLGTISSYRHTAACPLQSADRHIPVVFKIMWCSF